jgi:hypothetical protein
VADIEEPSPIDRFADIAKRLGIANGNSTVHVHVNAGGWGVSIAVGCCVVMMILSAVLLWVVGDIKGSTQKDISDMQSSANQAAAEARAQLREQGHQLNAIYRVAPSVEREVRARLEEDARLRAQASE